MVVIYMYKLGVDASGIAVIQPAKGQLEALEKEGYRQGYLGCQYESNTADGRWVVLQEILDEQGCVVGAVPVDRWTNKIKL